jgi:uncharacterized protein Yka (UPF0111/DUF47 family)
MGLIAKLLPSEDKFFVLMQALSAQTHEGATQLKKYVESSDAQERILIGRAIAQCKADAKVIMGRITHEVAISFVTPFDREDIQEFASNLYKIPKTIEKIYERLELHNLHSEKGDFSLQVDLIVQESQAMQEMVEALTKKGASKTIVEKADLLNDLEARGDAVLSELLAKLFSETRDVRDLLIRKDVYDMLEKVTDRYRDAAGVAVQIVLKHS